AGSSGAGSRTSARGAAPTSPAAADSTEVAWRLLPGDRRSPAAQDVLLNLPGPRLGELRHDVEAARHLEMGHVVARELAELALVERYAGLQHDERVWRFAPLLVGKADNGHFLDRRVPHQHPLDLN